MKNTDFKIINCEYIVVNNDEERKLVENYFGGSKTVFLNYPFSFVKERGFLFYSQKTEMTDFLDKDENEKYVYIKNTSLIPHL